MPTATATQPTMFLRHGDFHLMNADCWGDTFDWYLAHPHLKDREARDAYLTAVERQMLDNLMRSL